MRRVTRLPYRFASLPAGTYDLTAELQGFAKQVRQAVIVQVTTATTSGGNERIDDAPVGRVDAEHRDLYAGGVRL